MPEPVAAEEPAHRRRARISRLPVVGVVGVVVAAGLFIGRHGAPAPAAPAALPTGPVAAPAAALSSSWFCAGASDDVKGDAPGSLVVTNAGSGTLAVSIRLVPSSGADRVVTTSVGPEARIVVPETTKAGAPWIGAVVDLSGGSASVEQQISSPLGLSASPCATVGSPTWYFASGATLVNASSTLTLLNPYPSTAIVDLTFSTNEGTEQPGAFQGIVVPPDGLVAVDLRSHLRRRSFIATTITSTAGRVVAWKTDVVSRPRPGTPILGTKAAARPLADPASPFLGVSAVLGTPAPSTVWQWPEGVTEAGVNEQYEVYNPGSRTAQVALSVRLDQGAAEPFDLTVGPQQVTSVAMASEARIPPGIGYSTVLTSRNGVPVVAERTVAQGAPDSRRGIGELFGASAPARSWLLGAGVVDRSTDEVIVASNPQAAPATVSVEELAGSQRTALPGLSDVRVGGHGRLEIDLGKLTSRLDDPLVVTASAPVVVGRDLYGRGGATGVGLSLGVPLG